MLAHYLKVAYRNLVKYKTQSIISIIGLATGLTCFALSTLWIRYELGYDNFHEGKERIFFVGAPTITSGDGFSHHTPYPLADHIKQNYPEVEYACRIYERSLGDKLVYNEKEHQIASLGVDSGFVSMFRIKLLEGSLEFLQESSHQIAITKETAKRIFGSDSPIGQKVSFYNQERTVGAVVEGWKGQSIIPFDALSAVINRFDENNQWVNHRYYTFIRVVEGTDTEMLKEKFGKMPIPRYGTTMDEKFLLTPFTTIRSQHPLVELNVNVNQVQLFALTGALIVLCSLFNYLTLFIVRIRLRSHELALRKVNGSSNKSLMALLLTEFGLILTFSLLLGMLCVELTLAQFKDLAQIGESGISIIGEALLYYIVAITLAFVFSLFLIYYFRHRSLYAIMSGNHIQSNHIFRKMSLVLQLVISISFIFCTIVMTKQVYYLHNTIDVGFRRHNIGVLSLSAKDKHLADQIAQSTLITGMMINEETLVPKWSFGNFSSRGHKDPTQNYEFESFSINREFADFYDLHLIKGKMPDENSNHEVVVNETAVKNHVWDEPIGFIIKAHDEQFTITGVIQDVYYASPLYPVRSCIYLFNYVPPYSRSSNSTNVHFKFEEGKWEECKSMIESIVLKDNPDGSCRIYHVENEYDTYLKPAILFIKLLVIVSLVCIIIAVFGIFSLVTLSCEQRRKEVAVRKVNGATVKDIFFLFLNEYLILLVVSAIIAFPIGYYYMNLWLDNYAVRTNISGWIYLLIFFIVFAIIILSVISRVVQAARQNPSEVIKSE